MLIRVPPFAFLTLTLVASCSGSSLSIVMDESGSMYDEIKEIRKHWTPFSSIKGVDEMLLITFKDTINAKFVIKTNKITEMDAALRKVVPKGGGQCPSYALSGINLALEYSQNNSYILTFVDSSSYDYRRRAAIQRQCRIKQTKIMFVVTGACNNPDDRRFQVYYDLANICHGLAIRADYTLINEAIGVIKENINSKNILRHRQKHTDAINIPFCIHNKTDHVLIAVSGTDVQLFINGSVNFSHEKIIWTIFSKVVKIPKPRLGSYSVNINAKYHTVTNVDIMSLSDYSMTNGACKKILEAPEVIIVEGKTVNVPYGNKLRLTCRVRANPKPIVIWKTNRGEILRSMKRDNDCIYTVDRSDKTTSGIYKCTASNTQGSITKSVQVLVSSPFEIHSQLPDVVHGEYGTKVSLKCDVTSKFPMRIQWYHINDTTNEEKLVETSQQYSVSSNGNELTINAIDISLDGKYSCKAMLLGDEDEHIEFATEVKIVGLVPPEVSPIKSQIGIMEYTQVTLLCNLLRGNPKPNISWHFKAQGSTDYLRIEGSSPKIYIINATLANVGIYRCVAKNLAGKDEKDVADLQVFKAPEVTIVEGASVNLPYGSKLNLTCRITANPEPTVKWNHNGRDILKSVKPLKNGEFEYYYFNTIERTGKTDAGKYECTAENTWGTVTKATQVTISSPFEINLLLPDTINAGYGTHVHLKCDITSKFPMQIKWYHINNTTNEEKLVEASKQYSVSSNGNELTINAMDIGLDGKYFCKASLLDDIDEHVELATVLSMTGPEPPEVSPILKDITVNQHQQATLFCNVTKGNPKPNVSWRFKAQGSTNYQRIEGSNPELRIDNATLTDSGVYRCVAQNVAGKDEEDVADIKVTKVPEVTIVEGVNVNLTYGSNLSLTCRVTANPEPVVTWKHNGEEIRLSVTPLRRSEFEYDYSYSVGPSDKTVSGKYECTATNPKGSITKSVNVSVSSPFEIHSKLSDMTNGAYGTNVSLKCDITSKFPMQIKWYNLNNTTKEEILVENSEQYSVSPNGNELTINAMDIGLDGKYFCNASLLDDRDEHVEFATVLSITGLEPPEVSPILKEITVGENQQVALFCNVTKGNPKPNVSWRFKAQGSTNYQRIEGSNPELRIDNATLTDSGVYRCVAQNVAGKDEEDVGDIKVTKIPEVTIVEGVNVNLTYGSNLSLTCRVTANPEPVVTWKHNGEEIRLSVTPLRRSEFEYDYSYSVGPSDKTVSGKYECTATNPKGLITKSVNVSVSSPFENHSKLSDMTNAAYGTNVSLKCDITSKFPMQIKWYNLNNTTKEVILVENSEQYSVSPNGNELTINAMDIGLDGKYFCKASLLDDRDEHVEFATVLSITGLEPPEVSPILKEITVGENQQVALFCNVTKGNPKPNVSWRFKAQGSTNYQRIEGSNPELRIDNATLTDSGVYRCVAQNVAGKDEEDVADIKVTKVPEVTIVEGVNVNLTYGSNLSLTCRVTANPEPVVTWKHNGEEIRLSVKPLTDEYDYSYTIERSGKTISGTYECTASNSEGSVTMPVQVSVSSPFDVHSSLPDIINGTYETNVSLKCDITSKFPMQIKWYHINITTNEEKLVETLEHYFISSNGNELTINGMNIGLDGKYFCKASLLDDMDEHMELSTDVEIVGLVAPEIIGNRNKTVTEGSFTSIKCSVIKGVPKPSLYWQFVDADGQPNILNETTGELHIDNVTVAHSGLYMCIATNIVGTARHIVVLTVAVPARITTDDGTVFEGVVGDMALRIPCDAVGNPKPNFSWEVNGSPISPNDKYDIEDGALIIRNVADTDTNNYTCNATNAVGSDSKTFEGFVNNSTMMVESTYIDVLKGQNFDLSCNLSHGEPYKLDWYIDNSGSMPKPDGEVIHIENADIKHSGNYTCHVSDANGSGTKTYELYVGYAPSFENDDNSQFMYWQESVKSYLDCKTNSWPLPEVTWTLNGTELDTEQFYNKNQPDIIGYGIYKCHVENAHGALDRTFDIRPFP